VCVCVCVCVCVSTALWNVTGGAMKPLDDEQFRRITSLSTDLIEMIEWGSGLMAWLCKQNCLTTIQRMSIEPLQGPSRSERLLQIMSCKSVGEFHKFLRCLIETDQGHVEGLLTGRTGTVLRCLLLCFTEILL